MSLSLDDLGRAAADKVHEHEPEPNVTWDQIDDADKSIIRVAVLAAVERFVAALDDDTDIRSLLSSLRDEAGQRKGSAT